MIRIAHFSDVHFAFPHFSWKQFFSKQFLGNLHFFLRRKSQLSQKGIDSLPSLLSDLAVSHVIFTGDISTSSRHEEFERGTRWMEQFIQKGMQIYPLPGNHDCYTLSAERERRFIRHFGSFLPPLKVGGREYSLEKNRIAVREIEPGLWFVGLDTTLATAPLCSFGRFFSEVEQPLTFLLEQLKGETILLANHYPILHRAFFLRKMQREQSLINLLQKFPQVKLYLHGHTHQMRILDGEALSLPLIADSGSCSAEKHATFFLFEMEKREKRYDLQIYRYMYEEREGWHKSIAEENESRTLFHPSL